jgi:lysophospholipase L1-like esterase
MSTRPKNILITSCLVLFSTLLALGGLELAIRLLHIGEAKPWTDRPKRHYFSSQSRNTRDFKYQVQKPADTFRIVVVGDSFTFGYGNHFDDSFPKRLERILNLNGQSPKVEVINLGNPGNAIQHNVISVKKALSLLSPDLVILEVTLNDPELTPFGKDGNKVRLVNNEKPTGLAAHSKILQLVKSRITNSKSHKDYLNYFQGLFKEQATLVNFQTGVRQIAEACKAAKVPLVSTVFPLFSYPLDSEYPFKEAHMVIHTELEANAVPYLDLFNAYKGIPSIRLTADPVRDPHPNEIAHRIAADEMYEWMKRKKILPRAAIVKLSSTRRTAVRWFKE